MTTEEIECEKDFRETTKQSDDGRFVVKLPLKNTEETLGESFTHAKCRFLFLE